MPSLKSTFQLLGHEIPILNNPEESFEPESTNNLFALQDLGLLSQLCLVLELRAYSQSNRLADPSEAWTQSDYPILYINDLPRPNLFTFLAWATHCLTSIGNSAEGQLHVPALPRTLTGNTDVEIPHLRQLRASLPRMSDYFAQYDQPRVHQVLRAIYGADVDYGIRSDSPEDFFFARSVADMCIPLLGRPQIMESRHIEMQLPTLFQRAGRPLYSQYRRLNMDARHRSIASYGISTPIFPELSIPHLYMMFTQNAIGRSQMAVWIESFMLAEAQFIDAIAAVGWSLPTHYSHMLARVNDEHIPILRSHRQRQVAEEAKGRTGSSSDSSPLRRAIKTAVKSIKFE